MRIRTIGLTASAIVLAASSAFLVGAQAAAPSVARHAWEYMECENTGVVGQDDVGKDAGADGWELAAVTPPTPADSRYHFYYKRPK